MLLLLGLDGLDPVLDPLFSPRQRPDLLIDLAPLGRALALDGLDRVLVLPDPLPCLFPVALDIVELPAPARRRASASSGPFLPRASVSEGRRRVSSGRPRRPVSFCTGRRVPPGGRAAFRPRPGYPAIPSGRRCLSASRFLSWAKTLSLPGILMSSPQARSPIFFRAPALIWRSFLSLYLSRRSTDRRRAPARKALRRMRRRLSRRKMKDTSRRIKHSISQKTQ